MSDTLPHTHPIPLATYRLQLNRERTFRDAARLPPYLSSLGITHCYASPVLQARSGSAHGYDGVDPTRLNTELGGDEGFAEWDAALKAERLGLLLDIVPNHLCVVGGENPWWQDVLTHGRGSPHAAKFDINWMPDEPRLHGRVLLPLLGEAPAAVLAAGELHVRVERGALVLRYHEHRWPLAPASWPRLLAPLLQAPGIGGAERRRLRHLLGQLRGYRLPWQVRRALPREHHRTFATLCARLEALLAEAPAVAQALDGELERLHGEARGVPDPADPDGLPTRWAALLHDQAWVLADWRTAGTRLNYRRFFDITELAGLRQEDPQVFAATHARVLQLMAEGRVQGLRVDHPDGLAQPSAYLRRLRRAMSGALKRAGREGQGPAPAPGYLVIEKILDPGERRRGDWPVDGGTGYDLLYRLNAVQVDPAAASDFRAAYVRLTGDAEAFEEHVRAGKRLVLDTSLVGDLGRLARRLLAVAEHVPPTASLDEATARATISALVICLPVYRTYVADGGPAAEEDTHWIVAALAEAKRRHGELDPALLDWLVGLWLRPAQTVVEAQAEAPPTVRRAAARRAQDFVTRLQQLSGAAMAKGVEDTAFYRYVPLTSLNEVGGDPGAFGLPREAFHAWNRSRARRWPHALSATATHDTKRGEDVRARLNALSEIPAAWERAVRNWHALNASHRTQVAGAVVPDAGTEYLIYQTLVGAWPLGGQRSADWSGFPERIAAYVEKAAREAKRHTDWIHPDGAWESAVREFVVSILSTDGGRPFRERMEAFLRPVQPAGLYNALTQTLFKMALPGVPDFYQGTELWDFSLVDPDNRRPVDFQHRAELLAALPAQPTPELAETLLGAAEDGRIKLHLIRQGLALRQRQAGLFQGGSYRPLGAAGPRERNLVAFARTRGRDAVVAVGGRLFLGLPGGDDDPPAVPVGERAWGDDQLTGMPPGTYRDVLTGRILRTARRHLPEGASAESMASRPHMLSAAEVLAHLPVALLERVP